MTKDAIYNLINAKFIRWNSDRSIRRIYAFMFFKFLKTELSENDDIKIITSGLSKLVFSIKNHDKPILVYKTSPIFQYLFILKLKDCVKKYDMSYIIHSMDLPIKLMHEELTASDVRRKLSFIHNPRSK